ncbi:hypothetical protein I4U23_021563 [Adineta vaga]|nr:hypothetical protein I4U23_021563 [Adineta vaga]
MELLTLEDISSANLNEKIIPVPKQHKDNENDESETIPPVKTSRFPYLSHSFKLTSLFCLFTSIIMISGILIVYYKSPKPPGKNS